MTSPKKNFNWKNIAFVAVILLLIIPQTRTPIQVAVNKVMVMVFSPSAFAKEDQPQINPFSYKVQSLDGASKDISVGTGKIIFLSYWATWCPPCIAEMPSISQLYEDYGDKIEFVLISNEDPVTIKKFLNKKEYSLPAFIPRMETPALLFERSIPTTYIIDQKGNIIIKEKGAADWSSTSVRETLDSLLAQK